MDVFKIGALCLVSLSAVIILRGLKPEWATLLRIAAVIIIFATMLPMLATVIGYLREIAEGSGAELMDSVSLEILFKALSIALLTHFCASVCRDAGEGGLATLAEMAGKLEILLLSFPLIKEILEAVLSLLKLEV
ncbi:MAG: hypothetical protein E7589_06080 [Ruminococcaceae bacterium]|nr:hypothetical protein [Oscillospiraceae bacterium]